MANLLLVLLNIPEKANMNAEDKKFLTTLVCLQIITNHLPASQIEEGLPEWVIDEAVIMAEKLIDSLES